jgi:AcrR family transcriptional regulator
MSRKKKSYHHGNLRRALIDTATELIRERGMPEFTLRELARRLDVTHAATYHHFKDKRALLTAVAEDGHAALLERLEAVVAEGGARDHVLARVGEAYIGFASENAAHFGVMFSYHPEHDQGPTGALEALFGNLVAEAQRAGLFSDGASDELAVSIWAGYHGVASLVVQGCVGPGQVDGLIAHAHQAVMRPMPLAAAS